MKILFLLLLSSVIFQSCYKPPCGCVPPPSGVYYLKATVSATGDLACGKPQLQFEDTVTLKQITGSSGDMVIVNELPTSLNILNKNLWVWVGRIPAEEDFACLAIGYWYPHVKLFHASERE